MSRYRLAAGALFVALLVLVSGCGGGVSQREVLAGLTDHVITPRFASTQRGLSALEYLLFQDDDRLLRELGEPSSRFGEYLRALTAVIAEETAGVRDAWRWRGRRPVRRSRRSSDRRVAGDRRSGSRDDLPDRDG